MKKYKDIFYAREIERSYIYSLLNLMYEKFNNLPNWIGNLLFFIIFLVILGIPYFFATLISNGSSVDLIWILILCLMFYICYASKLKFELASMKLYNELTSNSLDIELYEEMLKYNAYIYSGNSLDICKQIIEEKTNNNFDEYMLYRLERLHFNIKGKDGLEYIFKNLKLEYGEKL